MIEQAVSHAMATPEVRLLLGCARTRVDSAGAEQIRSLLQRELDWPYITRMAQRHRLSSLLYWNLNTIAPGAVPAPALAHLRRQFYAIVRQSQCLIDELLALLALLDQHGIAAIPLKGPALTAAIYNHPALRLSSDLDLLVHKRDIARSVVVLQSRGYRQQFKRGPLWEAVSRPLRHAATFADPTGVLNVDLHWRLSQRYFACMLDAERLWAQLAPLKLNGRTIQSLKPDQMLLILCMHGARHTWERLAWVCDLAELLAAYPQLAWNAMLAQARQLRVMRMLLLGAGLAEMLLGANLPEAVRACVAADPVVGELAQQVVARLFEEHQGWAELEQARFYLRAREDWRDQLQYAPELLRISASLSAERVRGAGALIGRIVKHPARSGA